MRDERKEGTSIYIQRMVPLVTSSPYELKEGASIYIHGFTKLYSGPIQLI